MHIFLFSLATDPSQLILDSRGSWIEPGCQGGIPCAGRSDLCQQWCSDEIQPIPALLHWWSIHCAGINIISTSKKLYCPQSFSGGGLYLNGSWLLWSVYDGLLWLWWWLLWSVYDGLLLNVKNGLLWIVKNGLLWYMGHTCQFWGLWSRF